MRRRLQLEELDVRLVPTFYGNQLFPLDNPWNQNVSAAPVATNSNAIINRIVNRHTGSTLRLHADFGNPNTDGELYGIPINVVDNTVAKVTVVIPSFGYPGESDNVQVPIPSNAVIEGDLPNGPANPSNRGDSHLLVYDKSANVLYELYQAVRPNETVFPYGGNHPTGQWGAWQISYWDLKVNSFRTIGATSADAAGLPILPGLVRPDEALPSQQGVINHAIRFTVQQTRDMFVFPGSHVASSSSGTDLPRMGERFRLKASYAIPSNWSPEAKAIAQAMKDYGMIVADNGSDMYFTGTGSTLWNMSNVTQVQQIPASSFEVVDLTPAVTGLNVNSGSTAGGTSVTISGYNFGGTAGQLHVLFGTVEASSITIQSDSSVVAVAPAHAAGVVDIRVQSGSMQTDTDGNSVFFGYGTSPVVAADRFTFGGGGTGGNTPTANADAYSVLHDKTLNIAAAGVLANDTSNPAGHTLTATLVNGPSHGTLTLNTNGSFTYQPTAGYNGGDSFTYRANDAGLASNIATVSLSITDRAPIATLDSYKTGKGKPLTVNAAGVLTNDADGDGDALTAILVGNPANGAVTLNANGSFTYTPNSSFAGTDTFTYKANDKALDSSAATVSIVVSATPSVRSVVFNDGSAQRSLIRSITVTFDTLVTLDSGAFKLTRAGGGAPSITRTITEVNGETVVTMTFTGSGTAYRSLTDGNWTLKVLKARIHRADDKSVTMAADSVTTFHRYFGDSDGDRDVDGTDQAAFDYAYGKTDAASLARFDFNNDGDVDAGDRTQFNKRYGKTLA